MRRYFLYRPTWIEFNKIKLGQAFLLLAGRLGGRSRSREGEFLANIEIKIYDAEHLYNPHFPLLPRPTTAYQFYKYNSWKKSRQPCNWLQSFYGRKRRIATENDVKWPKPNQNQRKKSPKWQV